MKNFIKKIMRIYLFFEELYSLVNESSKVISLFGNLSLKSDDEPENLYYSYICRFVFHFLLLITIIIGFGLLFMILIWEMENTYKSNMLEVLNWFGISFILTVFFGLLFYFIYKYENLKNN